MKKFKTLYNVTFTYSDYKNCTPNNCLIYCDPPYKDTIQAYGFNKEFDTDEFWEIMRKWSKNNDVYISEYNAPDDFKCVLEIPTKTIIRDNNNNPIYRTEKLFTYNKI